MKINGQRRDYKNVAKKTYYAKSRAIRYARYIHNLGEK